MPPRSSSMRSRRTLILALATAWLIGVVRRWRVSPHQPLVQPLALARVRVSCPRSAHRALPGFYLRSGLFPAPRFTPETQNHAGQPSRLLLGPFCGKPACQLINVSPEQARGVCADAYLQRRTMLVTDVNAYPGHIACDGETKSEIVCPLLLLLPDGQSERTLGVFDLDCLALAGFDELDKFGLERVAKLVVDACDW